MADVEKVVQTYLASELGTYWGDKFKTKHLRNAEIARLLHTNGFNIRAIVGGRNRIMADCPKSWDFLKFIQAVRDVVIYEDIVFTDISFNSWTHRVSFVVE